MKCLGCGNNEAVFYWYYGKKYCPSCINKRIEESNNENPGLNKNSEVLLLELKGLLGVI